MMTIIRRPDGTFHASNVQIACCLFRWILYYDMSLNRAHIHTYVYMHCYTQRRMWCGEILSLTSSVMSLMTIKKRYK